MNDTLPFAPESNQVRLPVTLAAPAGSPNLRYTPAALRSVIAAWRERIYFRRELEQLLKNNPELIDDVGLTKRQIEAAIAKPFWRR